MIRGITIGLDIGSNSVGSAWIDEEHELIEVGCSVFPAGVEESDKGRGASKNEDRRMKRSARRNISRRSHRKRSLRRFLIQQGLLPTDKETAQALMQQNPWDLRRLAITQAVTPHQFGRILLHLAQRRGAAGLRPVDDEADKSDLDSDGPIKDAIDDTRKKMAEHDCQTFGQLVAMIAESEAEPVLNRSGKPKTDDSGNAITYRQKVRNSEKIFRFHADRDMIRDEFCLLWEYQHSLGGPLAKRLTDDLRRCLDDPTRDETWRHKGLLFQQRNTYWDVGTLGRCDLEPSDRVVPIADYDASRYRVIEYANNIRIKRPGKDAFEPLSLDEHQAVVTKLGQQKTATIKTVRSALKIDTASLRRTSYSVKDFQLNLERDQERPPNTDWFTRVIINEAIIANDDASFLELSPKLDRLNKAILRFDPAENTDAERFRATLLRLPLKPPTVDAIVEGWRTRPKLENRLKLSRRAIRNLLPYMEEPLADGHWRTQIEARIAFAEDPDALDASTGIAPSQMQRDRYRLGSGRLNSAARHYLKKHPEEFLPLPPVLNNPVVRKAIYEVRRHIVAYLKRHPGQWPDQIVIEFAREATKPAIVNDRILARNRNRNKIRLKIREQIIAPAWGAKYESLTYNQVKQAELRVLLCLQQRGVCAYSLDRVLDDETSIGGYSGRAITPRQAALGNGLEVDHVIPSSRSGDNSLNNKVLCFIDSNRNKGNRTLREWWGDQFDNRIQPLRFFETAKPPKDAYFDARDHAKKWRNLTADKVAKEWKGSQLSDTAYAAREVQQYLEAALWPDEPSYLAGGKRRVYVTRGGNTAKLRRDWQLYRQADPTEFPSSLEDDARQDAKNRGDHREHALDAIVIALTNENRLKALAKDVIAHNQAWTDARRMGERPRQLKRQPLPPPWGDLGAFRRQVLSLIYPVGAGDNPTSDTTTPMVVCHRAVGRKLTGKFHEESLFGPVKNVENGFRAKKNIADLSANHLRLPVPEKPKQAIARLTQRFQERNPELSKKEATTKARAIVEGDGFMPKKIDPPPGGSGLIRDIGLRRTLRKIIENRLDSLGIPRNADNFTSGDLKKMLTDECGPFRYPSGVPIKSFSLLRIMNEPVEMIRREFDYETMKWEDLSSPSSVRAHKGGNNHHLEIRQTVRGMWTGTVVTMSEAARRAKKQKIDPVDRSSDDERGTFVMSLAIGETVFMRHKISNEPGYFVVVSFNTEKKRAEFCAHWDARRAAGEKDDDNNLINHSKRETIPVSPAQMQALASPGYSTPVKVMITPLGDVTPVEPHDFVFADLDTIDPLVLEIAREGLSARRNRDPNDRSRHRRHGSWSWMRAKLKIAGKEHLAAQLSAATRTLIGEIT